MKIFSAPQIRDADAFTIENEPISSLDLMERASMQCAHWINNRFDKAIPLCFLCGMGNNGGDGLAIARILFNKGYHIKLFVVHYGKNKSSDFIANEQRLLNETTIKPKYVKSDEFIVGLRNNIVFIDAVFGSGLSKPIDGFIADIFNTINNQKRFVVSIDIPSGLFCDSNINNKGPIINAQDTLSFEVPKKVFFMPHFAEKVGKWHILPIGLDKNFIEQQTTDSYYLSIDYVRNIFKKRSKFSYKNVHGHALLLAGSKGMAGAALLSSKACLRAGAGLITAYVPQCIENVLHMYVPESLVTTDTCMTHISTIPDFEKYSAVAVGPGMGLHKDTIDVVKNICKNIKKPMVLDADALNIISLHPELLDNLPEQTILTPHLGEFQRLLDLRLNYDESVYEHLKVFSQKYKVITVLKGTYTCVCTPEGKMFFNATGNAGLATAGSGDVLTGIILGFLSQGYTPLNAALLGVYVHGLAADIAVSEYESEESLLAGDLSFYLGRAFKTIKQNR